MSLGLCCAGVELGGGGQRRGEGQVETCRVDGPGAVKADVRLGLTDLVSSGIRLLRCFCESRSRFSPSRSCLDSSF